MKKNKPYNHSQPILPTIHHAKNHPTTVALGALRGVFRTAFSHCMPLAQAALVVFAVLGEDHRLGSSGGKM